MTQNEIDALIYQKAKDNLMDEIVENVQPVAAAISQFLNANGPDRDLELFGSWLWNAVRLAKAHQNARVKK